jgi:hypothetical protein
MCRNGRIAVAVIAAWTVAGVTACGSSEGSLDKDSGPDAADTGAEAAGEADVADVAPEQAPEEIAAPDFGPAEDVAADVEPGDLPVEPGQLGAPCTFDSDCSWSGFCIQGPDGKVCAGLCSEECPPGWTCSAYNPGGPDLVYLCVPQFVSLCMPCKTSGQCAVNGIAAACIGHGDQGAFCADACAGGCPEGYECQQTTTLGGEAGSYCLPASGVCGCRKLFVDMGAATACTVTNEWGVCAGERTCTATGLSPCSAKVPAIETCNNKDDDCDGDVDEEAAGGECLLKNQFGTCVGVESCAGGVLSCQGQQAQAEQCNGLDDDCDGAVDETFTDTDKDGVADCLETDVDGDGTPDILDNCPAAANPMQEDLDMDLIGNACDPDDDGDGVADGQDCAALDKKIFPGAEDTCDGVDNDCNLLVDEGFPDTDGDGWKDCVDEDDDNDGTVDGLDCAPQVWATHPGAVEICDGTDNDCDGDVDENQPDTDEDGIKDCVDTDLDGDGVANAKDNCPSVGNKLQEDQDKDGLGDLCDTDLDGDSIPNDVDNCPLQPNTAQADNEKDGVGDACDPDDDNDQVADAADNCALVSNAGQQDADKDGVGDACEDDLDGDGTPDALDCAPADAAVSPKAVEKCDGVDNDCDGLQDEGFADFDGDGVKDCVDPDDDNDGDADDADCAPLNAAVHQDALEICDNVDNDCDGKVDEALGTVSCGKGACTHVESACTNGKATVCDPMKGATLEKCDGMDNDCDGLADEDLGTVTCGLGPCLHTVDKCSGGIQAVCDPLAGAGVEACDGVDNDCDGKVDEALGTVSCGKGLCAQTLPACVGGVETVCDPASGAKPEVCDGVDNDCDGDVDEEQGQTACGKGACFHTQPYCSNGKVLPCDPYQGASPETCDGVDNDCDGQADDDLGYTSCGTGACLKTVPKCLGGAPNVCDPKAGASAETCDAVDNDCDGKVDEGLGSTTCGLGECVHVQENCVEGQTVECDPFEGSQVEICDGLDNDCNGIVDDAFPDFDKDGMANCVDPDDDNDGDPDTTDCAPLNPAIYTGATENCTDNIDDDCDGLGSNDPDCLPLTCLSLHNQKPTLPSGQYTIDPDGPLGAMAPFKAACDMVTDGGGWTLVLAIRADASNGWHMYDYEANGLSVDALSLQVSGDVSTTAVLSKAAVNLIASQGNGQYLSDIGNGLFKLTMKDKAMDFYKGIYQTSYSNGYVSQILQTGGHTPNANPSWSNTDNSMATRSPCPGDMCHYIPDDVSGGSQWAHRHNTTPAAGSAGGYNWSRVFVR